MSLPGSGVVNRGLKILGGIAFGTADAFATVQCLSVDDNASNFAAADTALNTSRGTVTNVAAVNFSPTPTITAQTISFTSTFPASGAGNFNGFTVKGIGAHNITAASVTASSATLFAGIAGQSLAKTSAFSLAITLALLMTDNS